MVPTLVLRPAFGSTVIFHDHGPHEIHAHTISSSQLEDWCDEHQHWHERQEWGGQDSPEMPTSHDHSTDLSFNDVSYGAIVVVYQPLLARQDSRPILPLERCSMVPGFGKFLGVLSGQSLERRCLIDDTAQRLTAALSATASLLLRSHALLI